MTPQRRAVVQFGLGHRDFKERFNQPGIDGDGWLIVVAFKAMNARIIRHADVLTNRFNDAAAHHNGGIVEVFARCGDHPHADDGVAVGNRLAQGRFGGSQGAEQQHGPHHE